ncbi:MAG TPA: hypothetical protein VID48_02880 [Solirubrobacteraceae bacterium]|jgi:hypothetical protein
MAQTKRRRQTKHRGNAAGIVESRGRTGRKPTSAEKSGDRSRLEREKELKLDKRDRPPTWRGAFNRAMIAAVLMLLVSLLLFAHKNPSVVIEIFPIVLLMYVPISYYTDLWSYRRRQRKKANGRKAQSP